jgi:hypothetical protein
LLEVVAIGRKIAGKDPDTTFILKNGTVLELFYVKVAQFLVLGAFWTCPNFRVGPGLNPDHDTATMLR